jgi:hypothetical protein
VRFESVSSKDYDDLNIVVPYLNIKIKSGGGGGGGCGSISNRSSNVQRNSLSGL